MHKPISSVHLTVSEHLTAGSLQSRIDSIGFGPFQLMIITVSGISLFANGALFAAGKHFIDQSLMIVVMLFTCVGLGLGYFLSNSMGRRPLALAGIAIMGLSLYVGSAVAKTQGAIIGCLGSSFAGFGLSLPASIALSIESSPSTYRGLAIAILACFWTAGEHFTALMKLLTEPNEFCHVSATDECHFQLSMEYIAVVIFFSFMGGIFFLPESPIFFVNSDDCFSLNGLIASMRRFNRSGTDGVLIRFESTNRMPVPVATASVGTITLFGLLVGTSFVFMIDAISTPSLWEFAIVVPLCLLIGGGLPTLPQMSTRTLTMMTPLVIMTAACMHLVYGGDSLVLLSIMKSLAMSLIVFVLTFSASASDSLGLIIKILAVSQVCLTVWPLFLQLHSEPIQEAAFAILFGLCGALAVFAMPACLVTQTKATGYFGGSFEKIPVIQYKSNKLYT